MKTQRRRQFLCVAATTVASLHCNEAFALSEKIQSSLRKSDVEQGLREGLKFREQDSDILNLLQNYSDRQVMIGGGVLTFAAKQPTEWVHLIVRLDNLDAFIKTMNIPEMPWGGANANHGNTLSFEFKGQRYYIENLMEKEFRERMHGLTQPGKEVNGFRLEFAHDAVVYEIQSERHGDPFEAIDGGINIEMRRIAPAEGVSSAMRVLTEEKSMGIEPTRIERRSAEQTFKSSLVGGKLQEEECAHLLAGISRCAEYLEKHEVRDLVDSNLVESGVAMELGGKSREITSAFNRITRHVDSELNDGAIWHLAIQRVENTGEPEIEKSQNLTLSKIGGYNDFFARRDLSAASKRTASDKFIFQNREKSKNVEAILGIARRAPGAKAEPAASPPVAIPRSFANQSSDDDERHFTDIQEPEAPQNITITAEQPKTPEEPTGRKAKVKKIVNEVTEDLKEFSDKAWERLKEFEKTHGHLYR